VRRHDKKDINIPSVACHCNMPLVQHRWYGYGYGSVDSGV
jgi:hypothetical protein